MATKSKRARKAPPQARRKRVAPATSAVAKLRQELAEARAQQAATAEILKLISSSPTDAQPVFDRILASCERLFAGRRMGISLLGDDGKLHLGAYRGPGAGKFAKLFPMPADETTGAGAAIVKRRVMHYPDVLHERDVPPGVRSGTAATGTRSVIFAPLLSGGARIGAIFVGRSVAVPFSGKEIELLKAFAHQAAIAIKNVRLFNETKEALEHQTATAEILKVIASSPSDVQPVFDAIAASALRLIKGDTSVVTRVVGDQRHLVAFTTSSKESDEALKGYFPAPLRRGLVGMAIDTHQPVFVSDTETDPKISDQFRRNLRARGVRSDIIAPMLREDAVIGTISVSRKHPGEFASHHVSLLKTFADQAVIAIDNARRFNETKEALERQTATAEILKVISESPTDVQPVFDAIAKASVRLLGGFSAVVMRVIDNTIHLAALTSTSPAGDESLRNFYPRPLTGGTASRAIQSGLHAVCEDTETDTENPGGFREVTRARGIRSFVNMPMIREGAAIGLITVGRLEPGPFSKHSIDLLRTFADQAVIAIENVRLFNETKEALERQTATGEILSVISRSQTDVQPVFDTIAKNALRLCDGMFSAVGRFDGTVIHLAAYHNVKLEDAEEIRKAWPMTLESKTVTARAVRERAVVQIPDVRVEAQYGLGDLAKSMNYRSTLSVPMLRDGIPVGAITITRALPGKIPAEQVALLKTFADQAVIAIENVRLFNETKEALERQTATAEILSVIASSPTDTKPVFDAIARSAARLVDEVEVGILLRRDFEVVVAGHSRGVIEDLPEQVRRLPLDREKNYPSQVILDGKVLHIPDWEGADIPEFERNVAKAYGVKACLQVPLLRKGEGIGALVVSRALAGPFLDKDIALLQSFADQAVIAIENVRLFNETKEALERQTATAAILKVISQSPTDTRPVFEAIVNSCLPLFGGMNVALFLKRGDMLDRVAFSLAPGYTDPASDLFPLKIDPQAPGTSLRAMLTKELVQIADVASDPGASERSRQIARRMGFRSLMAAPLLREGEAIGVINVFRAEPSHFSAQQQELLKTVADQAVIAIENVRLFKELQTRNRDLTVALEQQTATGEILKTISSSPTDVQPVFDTIVRNAVRLGSAAVGFLISYDGTTMELAAQYNVDPQEASIYRPAFPRPAGRDTMTGRSIIERTVINVADIWSSDFGEGTKERARRAGYHSALIVPMLRGGAAIGSLNIQSREVGAFSDSYIALLQTFSDQAVIAIENVRLFNETKESLERQTATAEILNVISRSNTDTKPVFDAIARAAQRVFGGLASGISLVEGDSARIVAMAGDMPEDEARRERVMPLNRETAHARAIVDRAIVNIGDTQAPDAPKITRKTSRQLGFRAIAVAPIMSQGEAIGAISVARSGPGAFNSNQLGLLQTFADQAAIAIENVRLFNQTREALERQTATAEILKVIASSPSDVQPVFDAIVAHARTLVGGQTALVTRLVGDQLHLAARTTADDAGDDAVARRYPQPVADAYSSGPAIRTRAPHQVADVQADPSVPAGGRAVGAARGFRSLLSVPMLKDGEPIGTINVGRREPGAFSAHQVELLKTFADQAVIAIENVRLFNETKEALERQTATAEILKVIASSPSDAQPVFEAIVQSGLKLFSGAGVGISIVDGGELRVVAATGNLSAAAKGMHLPISRQSASGLAIVEKRVVNIRDTEAPDAPPHARDNGRKLGIRSMTQAPMFREEEPVGVIGVTLKEPGGLDDKQLALLKTFADQAVIAIENVRLFKELQARTEALTKSVGQLTALGEVGQAISSTLDLETVLQTIVSRAVQLTGLDGGSIYEYDEHAEVFLLRAAENLPEDVLAALRRTPIQKGDGPVGKTVTTREPSQIPEMQRGSYQTARRELLLRAGYRALLVVPMLREDHVVGALSVARKAPGEFAPEVVELLKTFATQSAMAIQNARLYREIAEKGKQLEIASRHKSQFLASMSHELRTPLNAILGFNEMILGQVYGEVPADMAEPLNDIQTSGKHLLRLINNVLDLAKIEAGRMELSLQDYSVQDTVESVRATLRPLAAEKGLEFLATVPAELPLAYGDSGRITQCLMNLAGNSLKFTKAGKVEIAVAEKDGLLTYRVTDTGVGIPPDKIGSLFTEFKQTDATIASEYGGTGLGLSISKKFVEMHGGRIWIESEPGKGSAFIFEIPLRVKTP